MEIIAFSAPRSSGSLRSELMPFWVLFGSAGDRWCLDPFSVVSSTHPPHLIVFRDVSRSHNSLRKSTRFQQRAPPLFQILTLYVLQTGLVPNNNKIIDASSRKKEKKKKRNFFFLFSKLKQSLFLHCLAPN